MDEPVWVSRVVADGVHHAQVQEHGGRYGTRDEGAVESALARPKHKLADQSDADIADLAAAYLFGLATSHGYVDGNKRAAVVISLIFLELNGYEIDRSDDDVVATALAVATHDMEEGVLATWFRDALMQLPPPGSETSAAAE